MRTFVQLLLSSRTSFATKPVGLGLAAASASPLVESRVAGPVGRRMVHHDRSSPTGQPGRVCGRQQHPSAALLRAAALLDSTPLDLESGGFHAGDVGGVGAGWDGCYLCLVAASGAAPRTGDVSCAVGVFTVPFAPCPDGALLQYAADVGLVSDLHGPAVGRAAA